MNVEVKIQCDCGTRYKFDVQPLNGRMPQKVSCPGCGVDGTAVANVFLRDKLRAAASEPASSRRRGFVLGITGAIVAGVVAMFAWCFLIQITGHQLGFAAWGVGLLIGLGARGLGREGGLPLGLAAGTCALLAILCGQLLAAQSRPGNLRTLFTDGSVGWLTLLWLLMAVLSAFKLGASKPSR